MLHPSDHERMPRFGGPEALQPRVLGPHEEVVIDLDAPHPANDDMRRDTGINGKLVAVVQADSKAFMVVDMRGTKSSRDFFVVDENFSKKHNTGFKGVKEGETLVMGRDHHLTKFNYPSTVSRDHFDVRYYDGELFVQNLNPTNETTVIANLVDEEDTVPDLVIPRRAVEAIRTVQAHDRIQRHPNFGESDSRAPYGYYLNYPILGRDSTAVDGGVYLGGSPREAIVVDGKSLAMRQAYESVATDLRASFKNNETLPLQAVLLKVMNRVQEVMPYDDRNTERISAQHNGDKPVGLSTYLKEKAGVCRHQALLAAYILENLIDDGHILGSVGVERNTVREMGGTHAWAVYKTESNGAEEVTVVDPAQSFVGTKEQALREGRWEYRLSVDEY